MKHSMKNFLILFSLLLIFWGMEKRSQADDLDVYSGGSSIGPNVLIIFDNSTSMADKVPYDDTVDYSTYIVPANVTTCMEAYARETIYYRTTDCCGGNSSGIGEKCNEITGCSQFSKSCLWYKHSPRTSTMRAFVDANKNGQDDQNCQWDTNGECYIENNVKQLYKGNYLNYRIWYNENKYTAAKNAVIDLLTQFQSKINFGLMVFRNDETACASYVEYPAGSKSYYPKTDGGYVLEPCGPNKLIAITNWLNHQRAKPGGITQGVPSHCAFKPDLKGVMFTPLAEALTHAGMYYEGGWNGSLYGKNINQCANYNGIILGLLDPNNASNCVNKLPFKVPIYNTDQYIDLGNSPAKLQAEDIKYRCQTNHVILMTDGNPAHDGNARILKKYIPTLAWNNVDDFNEIAQPNCGNDKLCAVAKALYDLDLAPPLKRNISTHVIGFGLENDLLKNSATNGGGEFVKAGNAEALKEAFKKIIVSITAQNVIISANPTIPSSGMTSGDTIYVPFASTNFKEGGDVQKYKFSNGAVKGCDGTAVTNTTTGLFIDNYEGHACWSVNDKLADLSTRSIYTYFCKDENGVDKSDINSCDEKYINISANLFDKTNTNIKPKTLGYCVNNANGDTDPTCLAKRDTLIAYVQGYEATNPSQKRVKILGGVLHSSPLVVSYDGKTVVYFGANDGMLHAVDDSSGSEMWAFIPPNLLPTLKLMAISPEGRNYYVDSSPRLVALNGKGTVYNPNDNQNQTENRLAKRILVFGQRTGGSNYYALDVTDYNQPKFLWEISSTSHSGLYGYLAQTWSEPVFGNLNVGTGDQKAAKAVAFFGNGFSDTKQGAVYAADVLTGQRRWAKTDPSMKSIPSQVLAYDEDDDGYIERLYVGDLGGQLWAFNLKNQPGQAEAARRLFTSSCGNQSCKIFYPPDLVKEQGTYHLYFGTGDRNDPMGTKQIDRFYCVKDKYNFTTVNLTEANLANVNSVENTLATLTDANERLKTINSIKQKDGWYIIFDAPVGEKVLATPTVFLGVVFFATFNPAAPIVSATNLDSCSGSVGGTVRLYALNYLTGLAVFPWDTANTKKDSNNNPILGKADRSQKLSLTGIPSEVIITIQPPQLQQGAAPPSGKAGGTVTPTVAGGAGIAAPTGISITLNLLEYSWRVVNP